MLCVCAFFAMAGAAASLAAKVHCVLVADERCRAQTEPHLDTRRPDWTLDRTSQSHPLNYSKAWIFVRLDARGRVDFSHPPTAQASSPGAQLLCSLDGLSGVALAVRLPMREWSPWLKKGAADHAVQQLAERPGAVPAHKDDFDLTGDFVAKRWTRYQALATRRLPRLGPAPPLCWWAQAVRAVAEAQLLTIPLAALPPAEHHVLAEAPPRASSLRSGSSTQRDGFPEYSFPGQKRRADDDINIFGRAVQEAAVKARKRGLGDGRPPLSGAEALKLALE